MSVLLVVGGAAMAQPNTGGFDVPGLGASIKPRVLVILDNSRSMEELPNGTQDLSAIGDDFTQSKASLVNGNCSLTQLADGGVVIPLVDGGSIACRNKFCQAKCIMHNILDPYDGLFDVSFATYYQYYLQATTQVGSSVSSTASCVYDVIAKPGFQPPTTNNQIIWSKLNNLDTLGQCTITQNGSTAFLQSRVGPQGQWSPARGSISGSSKEFVCASNAVGEPAKNCYRVDGGAGYVWINDSNYPGANSTGNTTVSTDAGILTATAANNFFQFERWTPLSGTFAAPGASMVSATPKPYKALKCSTGSASPGGTCVTNALYPGFTAADTQDSFTTSTAMTWLPSLNRDNETYYLYDMYTYPDPTVAGYTATAIETTLAAATTGPDGGCKDTYRSNANFGGVTCTPDSPCDFKLLAIRVPTNPQTTYADNGATPTIGGNVCARGTPVSGTATVTYTSPTFYASNPGTCPAVAAVAAGTGNCANSTVACPYTSSAVVSASALTGFNNSDLGATYVSGGFNYAKTGGPVNDGSTFAGTSGTIPGNTVPPGTCPATAPCTATGGSFTAACTAAPYASVSSTVIPSCTTSSEGVTTCTYTTNYTCMYQKKKWTYSAPRWQCQYSQTPWNYNCATATKYCDWQTTRYRWRAKVDKYYWTSAGGEIYNSATVNLTLPGDATNICGPTPPPNTGTLPASCPARFLPTDPAAPANCKVGYAEECRLRWASTSSRGGYAFAKGRRQNSVSAPTNGSEVYCRAADYTNVGNIDSDFAFTYLNSNSSNNGWCSFSQGTTPTNLSYTFVMNDPYSPTLNSSNPALTPGQPFVLGGSIVSAQYSLDGTTWQATPPTNQKNVGWSRIDDTNVVRSLASPTLDIQGGVPMFVPFGTAQPQLPTLRSSVLNLRMAERLTPTITSPVVIGSSPVTGNNPTLVTGLDTPLYGSLRNATDYLQYTLLRDKSGDANGDGIDDDGDETSTNYYSKCRPYSVLLITDGQESQTSVHPQYPGQNAYDNFDVAGNSATPGTLRYAVAQLRDISDGSGHKPKGNKVDLYVIGFGAGGGNLDEMAREAGTQIGSADGGTAYSASSPAALQTQLATIFSALAESRYSFSKPVVTLDANQQRVYAASFDVKANDVEFYGTFDSFNLGDVAAVAATPTARWSVRPVIYGQAPGSRRILARRPLATSLSNLASLSAGEYTSFKPAMSVATNAELDTVVNWMINRNGNEAYTGVGQFRKERLGDIFHSAPAVIGPPRAGDQWPGEDTLEIAGYKLFKQLKANRPSRVFIGSNDGMVHAICEQTGNAAYDCGPAGSTAGSEVYSYVPSGALFRLKDNRTSHTFTADGSFGGGDMCLAADCSDPNNWKSFLLGSMHAGGRSFFALDVTDANTPVFHWDFSHAQLGYTWSPPTVARTVNVSASSGPTSRWVAIAGGGYMAPTVTATPRIEGNSFMVIDMHSPSSGQANLVTDTSNTPAVYRVDSNPLTCDTLDSADPSFASLCPLKRNSVTSRIGVARRGVTGVAEQAIFGDTQGRMWSSDLTGSFVSTWAPSKLFDTHSCPVDVYGAANAPVKQVDIVAGDIVETQVDQLPFPAVDDPRPIFQRASLARDSSGRLQAFVGTGDVLNPGGVGTVEANPKHHDYFYGVQASPGSPGCAGTAMWVKRFPMGVKQLSEGVIGGSVVFVPTYVPPANGDVCNNRGDARIYAFYASTGQPAKVFPPTTGPDNATTRKAYADLPGAGIISDLSFAATSSDSGKLIYVDSAGRPAAPEVKGLGTPARIKNWRRVR